MKKYNLKYKGHKLSLYVWVTDVKITVQVEDRVGAAFFSASEAIHFINGVIRDFKVNVSNLENLIGGYSKIICREEQTCNIGLGLNEIK